MRRCRWAVLLLASLACTSLPALAQQLLDWTQAPGRLGLGYPVPIPQDTPLPFDGFRSYAGLHTRHQDLDLAHDTLTGEVLGQTVRGRDIWLYRFGDPNRPDNEGRPRPAILINGGIHAREWQSPEVVTGLLELLAQGQGDGHWLSYLRDNVNILMIPVLNIDGFLQTQRYPRSNYLGTDPGDPQNSPRDGRMRRKNHRGADENLFTAGDHLQGVDLNRNSPPFWPGPPVNSNPLGLVYRGASAGSEPEIQALRAAAERGPAERLRFYADMHSFGKVFFSVNTGHARRGLIQGQALAMAIAHHQALPGAKLYQDVLEVAGQGIGTTAEYFGYTYQIPALTWELEPGSTGAVEYGGFGSNGHDGFILPESQIRRVRENSALSLAAVAYHMAGPAHLQTLQVLDEASGALLLDSQWRLNAPATGRQLQRRQLRALEPGRGYRLWLAFNKPMRWRDNTGAIVPFPGQSAANLDLQLTLHVGNTALAIETSAVTWASSAGASPLGFSRYRDDAVSLRLVVTDSPGNRAALAQAQTAGTPVRLHLDAHDMTGRRLDANPATPVDWRQGAWDGYEDDGGVAGDRGGVDSSQVLPVSLTAQEPAFPVSPGHSATWFDQARSGEGFMLENLGGQRALVYWFTYDEAGRQRWLTGEGAISGNRIHFPLLYLTSGGRFGPGFDPGTVVRQVVGSGEFWFADCAGGWFDYAALGQRGRFELRRTSHTMAIDCDPGGIGPTLPQAGQSGSWYDLTHSGEGFALQWMTSAAVILTWYSYDTQGRQYWMLGVGSLQGDEIVFPDLHATRGARFGAAFDPAQVERFLWGELRLRLGCQQGTASYQSVLPEFGSGSFQLHRLTGLAGLACPTPAP